MTGGYQVLRERDYQTSAAELIEINQDAETQQQQCSPRAREWLQWRPRHDVLRFGPGLSVALGVDLSTSTSLHLPRGIGAK